MRLNSRKIEIKLREELRNRKEGRKLERRKEDEAWRGKGRGDEKGGKEETKKIEEKKKGRRRGWLPPTPKLKVRVNDESFLGLCFRESFRERKTKHHTNSSLLKQ